MPLGLPAPGQVGGPWGGDLFPPWFNSAAAAAGMDALTAANAFAAWAASPEGAQYDLGWYWNQFRPGGQLSGIPFTENVHNTTYTGQTTPNQPAPQTGGPTIGVGGTPTPAPSGGYGPGAQQNGGPAPAQPTQNNGAGLRPTAPPPGEDPNSGRWVMSGGRWQWRRGLSPGQVAGQNQQNQQNQPGGVPPGTGGINTEPPTTQDPPIAPPAEQAADPWSRASSVPSPNAAVTNRPHSGGSLAPTGNRAPAPTPGPTAPQPNPNQADSLFQRPTRPYPPRPQPKRKKQGFSAQSGTPRPAGSFLGSGYQ